MQTAILAAVLMAMLPLLDVIKNDLPREWRRSAFAIGLSRFQGETFFETTLDWWEWPRHRRVFVWGRGFWFLRV